MGLYENLIESQAHTTCHTDATGRYHRYAANPAPDWMVCLCGEVTAEQDRRWSAQRWNGGVFLEDILKDMYDRPGISVYLPKGTRLEGNIIRAARPYLDATKDDMSWISADVLRKHPDHVALTLAKVLVLPQGYAAKMIDGITYIMADHPKRVFSELVSKYFVNPQALWPSGGNIAPDAVIGSRVRIAPGVVIGLGVVIGDDVEIGPNTCIANAEIGNRVRIGANNSIGLPGFGFTPDDSGRQHRFPQIGRVVIEEDAEIANNTCIDRGALGNTIIRRGAKIDNLVHVAHNCVIGEYALVIANATLCGGTTVGRGSTVAPSATIREQLTVGERALVGLGAVVVKDVPAGEVVVGNPAHPLQSRST